MDRKSIVLLFVLLVLGMGIKAQEDTLPKTKVYKFDLKQDISPAAWRITKNAFAEAYEWGAELILIHMNTYGGAVVEADSIRTKVLNSGIPVYVFIDNNAASAGALISMACDSIYMRTGANIGAATVVNQTGEAMPDKYQSYFRSIMRATAEAQGKDTLIQGNDTIVKWRRDPKIAEAMVDQSLYIEGISDTGKVLTLTPSEAVNLGFCEGIVDNIDQLLEKANIERYEIKGYRTTGMDKIMGFLMNPVVSGLLIMAIIGGIYFEMQTPGIGFPLAIAILAAILYFAPLYLEGLAANWEILIFILGLILIAIEIFVIPGFGITGILGIVLAISGLTLSLIDNVTFDFKGVPGEAITKALLTVLFSIIAAVILSVSIAAKIFSARSGPIARLALTESQNVEDGYIAVDRTLKNLVGKVGIAQTVLRPSGTVIVEGDQYDAISEIGFIEAGESVVVKRQENMQIYVEKKNS